MPAIELQNKIKLSLAITAVQWLLVSCSSDTPEQGGGFPPPPVSVAEVIVRNVAPWVEFSGRIEAKEYVQIRPRVGGVIEEVRYREGDLVEKGDLLFVLDQVPFRTELTRTEAELTSAQVQAKFANQESQRAKNVFASRLLSQDEYDQRIAAENQAKANVRSTEASVKLARLNMKYTEIRSPINGRTGRAFVTRGNLVVSDPTPDLLTTIVSQDPMYVYFDCDEQTYLKLSKNAQLKHVEGNQQIKQVVFVGLSNEEGFPHKGYVDFVDNQVNPTTGTIRLRAILENKDNQFTPGLYARIKLVGNVSNPTILIDEYAILTDQNRKYVYVVGPKNKALRRNIKIGSGNEGLRIVTDGLKAGEKVIIHGVQKVFFSGMAVTPQHIKMGDPPPTPGQAPAPEH